MCDIPRTWSSATTWSSPDHITISANTTLTIHSPYRDTTPWEAHLSDHTLLGVTIISFGKVHNSRRRTPFPRFRKDKETEYAEKVAILLGDSPPSPISFTKACISTHLALASSPRYTKQSTPGHTLYTQNISITGCTSTPVGKTWFPAYPAPPPHYYRTTVGQSCPCTQDRVPQRHY